QFDEPDQQYKQERVSVSMFSRSTSSGLTARKTAFHSVLFGALALGCMSFPANAQWVTAYYVNTSISVNDIPWSKATHVVDLGMSPADTSGTLTGILGSDADAFTSAAHAAGKKALLCVRDRDGNISLFGQVLSSNLNGFVGN